MGFQHAVYPAGEPSNMLSDERICQNVLISAEGAADRTVSLARGICIPSEE